MVYVHGRISHGLDVQVLNALVLCLTVTETLIYSPHIIVESRASSIMLPHEPATTRCMSSERYVFAACFRGGTFHELDVVFIALVLRLTVIEPLMYSPFIPVESRAGLIVFPPELVTT